MDYLAERYAIYLYSITGEVEAGGLWGWNWFGLHSKFEPNLDYTARLSLKKKKNTTQNNKQNKNLTKKSIFYPLF